MGWVERSQRGDGASWLSELGLFLNLDGKGRSRDDITSQRGRELDGEDSAWSRERVKGEKKEGQWQWGYVRKLQEWLSVREYILKGLEFYFLFSIFFLENFEEKRKLRRNLSIYSNLLDFLIFIFLVLTRLLYSISLM